MTEKYHILSDDLTNHHRMTELQYQTGYWKNGIDCLKEVDTLSVKQIPSLTEGKSSNENKIIPYTRTLF